MSDGPRVPGTGAGPPQEPARGVPRWLRVVGIVVVIVLLLVVVVRLAGGGGEHGPARHMSSGAGRHAPAVTGPAQAGGVEQHRLPAAGLRR